VLKQFYERLRARGKLEKVALVAENGIRGLKSIHFGVQVGDLVVEVVRRWCMLR